MKRLRLFFIISLSAIILFSFSACKKPEDTGKTEVMQEMPREFPVTAEQTIRNLAPLIPENIDAAIFFASYGEIVKTVENAKSWNVINPDEIDAIFNDLSQHYLINPASLKSYYDAGFNTGAGLAIGVKNNVPFAIFEIVDIDRFNQFWDNFVNEEFGRPRSHAEIIDGITYNQTNVLKKDLVTIVTMPNQIILVAGPELLGRGTHSSLAVAQSIVQEAKKAPLSKARQFNVVSPALSQEAFALFVPNSDFLQKYLRKDLLDGLNSEWDSYAATLRVTTGQLSVKLLGTLKENAPVPMTVTKAPANDENKAKTALGFDPSSAASLTFNPAEVEKTLIQLLPQQKADRWASIKSKLSQRFIGLDFQTQILDNFTGSAYVNFYNINREQLRNSTLSMDSLSAINASIVIPFADPQKSNQFFGKVNVLKSFVQSDKITITSEEDGSLHLILSQGKTNLHISYLEGILQIDTEPSWKARKTRIPVPVRQIFEPVYNGRNVIALELNMADLVDILSVNYEIISVQISRFLTPFKQLHLNAQADQSHVTANLTIDISPVAVENAVSIQKK